MHDVNFVHEMVPNIVEESLLLLLCPYLFVELDEVGHDVPSKNLLRTKETSPKSSGEAAG